MTQVRLQGWWKFRLVGALMIGGAIASSGGYTLAQTPCLPGEVCLIEPPAIGPHQPQPSASIWEKIRELWRLYPQAIQQLQQDDPQAIQKLQQLEPETLQKLERLAPNSTQQLQLYAPKVIQRYPNLPAQ
ncbi:hypothetical protein [Scytonema sp. PCC 10023]|uniref:hypothetical protein n=1 Tax=Scytonema sp. PCC 10023 TaxID=1680591 RepID=UPI0039C7166C